VVNLDVETAPEFSLDMDKAIIKPSEKDITRYLVILIVISTVVRALVAAFTDLGNDEAYYWTYALYPDLSHFDHPPMVGFMIQLFTANLHLPGEFFMRLSSVLFGALNTWLIFRIGSRLRNAYTGFYAALLYTGSVYCFVIAGIFILPDTPQLLFWLLSLHLLLGSLNADPATKKEKSRLLLAGLTIGLAMLSKYTAVFLWVGALLYILFYDRKWLKTKELYLALSFSALLFLPVIIWNVKNGFISFTYHSERVDILSGGLRPDFFLTELGGQFFYNNPVNVILILTALWAVVRKRTFLKRGLTAALLFYSLPLILLFLLFALFRATLPHWTGPGYIALMLLAAAWLDERQRLSSRRVMVPLWNKISLGLLLVIMATGFIQIRTGFIPFNRWHIGDPSMEMYGWKQLRHKFTPLYRDDIQQGRMNPGSVIITSKWFPAAHLDYYVATPEHIPLFAVNTLGEIHKYAWIDKERVGLKKGTDAWYITTDTYYSDPARLYGGLFREISQPDTLLIDRGNKVMREVYVYRMKDLLRLPEDELPGH
jgi:hypothetical protein